ncbi:MAG: glycosyltransferase family 2 protein, partial [Gemmatimonadota bacterium]|nr:glycosyltransferase family 2 protein [Gemmatimonadota bacterium]
MSTIGAVLVGFPLAAFAWAYLAYPATLWVAARFRRSRHQPSGDPEEWPSVSISLPAYNEEAQIGGALDAILELDYPRDRLQVLVVSDASSDRTDEIVRSYAERGVELLRIEGRGGKTAAENAAAPHLRGDIVVNTDASIRLRPGSLKPLVRALDDPTVGVASGRDISIARDEDANLGEGGYVGYEMWVRSLESDTGTIVGASGCYYATRRELHLPPEPPNLSRDFASALRARERGYRSVHVPDAVCLVPRSGSMTRETGRKGRTMSRGLATLGYHRGLLNPLRYGSFALKLFSHKLCRWLVFLLAPLALPGLALLATESSLALAVLAVVSAGLLVGWWGLGRT